MDSAVDNLPDRVAEENKCRDVLQNFATADGSRPYFEILVSLSYIFDSLILKLHSSNGLQSAKQKYWKFS